VGVPARQSDLADLPARIPRGSDSDTTPAHFVVRRASPGEHVDRLVPAQVPASRRVHARTAAPPVRAHRPGGLGAAGGAAPAGRFRTAASPGLLVLLRDGSRDTPGVGLLRVLLALPARRAGHA